MRPYEAIDRGVEISGDAIIALLDAMEAVEKGPKLLEAVGIKDPMPGSWHSQQAFLDALRLFEEIHGSDRLRGVGLCIFGSAKFPPRIRDIHQALTSIDIAYHMNHRKGEIGHYSYTQIDEHSGYLECNNPFPCEFDQGVIMGVAQRFCPSGRKLQIQAHLPKPQCRKSGASACFYLVSWV
jgi:hypothetical protein